MRKFLIIGLYDDGQRWADSFEADTPEAAEMLAPSDIEVAGVVELVGNEMQVVL